MMIDAVPAMPPNVAENQVRALATTGKARSTVLPNVPTMTGYEATIWLGPMAPEGTPTPIIDKLNAAVNAAIKRPEVEKLWAAQGAAPMTMTPEVFDAFLRADIVKWAGVVKRLEKALEAHSRKDRERRNRAHEDVEHPKRRRGAGPGAQPRAGI